MGDDRIEFADGTFGKGNERAGLQCAADAAKTQKNQDISFIQPDTGKGCRKIDTKNQQQRTIQKNQNVFNHDKSPNSKAK